MEMVRDMKEIVKDSGLSLSEIAARTGLSKTTVSMVVNGKYKGSEDVIKRIRRVIQDAMVRERAGGFVTKGQKLIEAVLADTYEYNDFAVIGGDSGIGKTYTVRRFVERHPDVLYVKLRVRMPYGQIINVMLKQMHASIKGGADDRLERLMEVLEDRGIRMVIVDEADLMASSRDTFKHKVEIFREIWRDGEGVSVVLIGLANLYNAVVGLGDTYILSRIGHLIRVPNPVFDELMEYWRWLTGWDADGKAKKAVELSMERGWFRMLQKIYMRAQKIGVENAVALLGRGW